MELFEYTLWKVIPSMPSRAWYNMGSVISDNILEAEKELRRLMEKGHDYIVTFKNIR